MRSFLHLASAALLVACNGGGSSLPDTASRAVRDDNPYNPPNNDPTGLVDTGAGKGGAAGAGAAGKGGSSAAGSPGAGGAATGGSGTTPVDPSQTWCGQPPVKSPPTGPMTSGGCSLVGGVWDIEIDTWNNAPPVTMQFDAAGRFVLADKGSDPCAKPKLFGLYKLEEGLFTIESTKGGVGCYINSSSSHFIEFFPDCDTAYLKVTGDDCTGAGLLQDGGLMKRRY